MDREPHKDFFSSYTKTFGMSVNSLLVDIFLSSATGDFISQEVLNAPSGFDTFHLFDLFSGAIGTNLM